LSCISDRIEPISRIMLEALNLDRVGAIPYPS
jgi:hypothetical protein